MQDFEQQLLRIKQVLGVSEDQEVAEALGLSRAALSDRKRRNAFPEDKLYALAARRPDLKISPDFVLNGPGGTTLVEVKPAPVAPMGSAFGAAMELLIKRANQRGVHALADAGLDVLYVLTGQRGPGRSGQAAAPSYALLAQCVHAAAAALSARGLVVDEDQAGRLYWSLYLSCLPQGAFNAALVDPLVNMIPSQQP